MSHGQFPVLPVGLVQERRGDTLRQLGLQTGHLEQARILCVCVCKCVCVHVCASARARCMCAHMSVYVYNAWHMCRDLWVYSVILYTLSL